MKCLSLAARLPTLYVTRTPHVLSVLSQTALKFATNCFAWDYQSTWFDPGTSFPAYASRPSSTRPTTRISIQKKQPSTPLTGWSFMEQHMTLGTTSASTITPGPIFDMRIHSEVFAPQLRH